MKKLALVLGGGAAKGYAHIGVIKALENAKKNMSKEDQNVLKTYIKDLKEQQGNIGKEGKVFNAISKHLN